MQPELGQLIQRRRKTLGVSQVKLSQMAEISLHTLSDIESGKGNPTLGTLGQILEILGLEMKLQVKQRI